MIRKAGISLLRLLIGIGFTFSLVLGVTLTLLTFCDGSDNTLMLSRTGLDWGWGGGAAIAWALTLFWWLCWRCLPAVKPTKPFFLLSKGTGFSKGAESRGMTIVTALLTTPLLASATYHLVMHRQTHEWLWVFVYGVAATSSWSQLFQDWRSKRQERR